LTNRRVLAIDFGERRIGIALSDPANIIASPFCTIDTRSIADPIAKIASIIQDEDAGSVVVGYPYHNSGAAGDKAGAIDGLIEALQHAVGPSIRIVRIDEGYSSVAAQEILKKQGKNTRENKDAVDRIAAALFLQDYLNEKDHA